MRTKPCLTSADAHKMMAACKAEAEKNNWKVSIAIVDDAGALLHLERLDGAGPTTAEGAHGKARMAALTKQPTKVWEDRGERQRTHHQSHDRRRPDPGRRSARDRQCAVRADGLRRAGAAGHHDFRRIPAGERDGSAERGSRLHAVPLPAQSARGEGGGRIRLRAGGGRHRLGHRERALAFRRAHQRISRHPGAPVRVAAERKKVPLRRGEA